ncbi:AraC family transcriptional regulator [Roseibium polysiphoniae]|uniref:AraC family transcriptional regulator n=2 Tax=Roseibium polysiphoniae TaxID=2571221 RepID=A0A944GQJ8_9HYPH|nr:AraC family transcriptional regulator [Roseibium polysiphoniae]
MGSVSDTANEPPPLDLPRSGHLNLMFVSLDRHKHYVTKEDLMDQPGAQHMRWVGPSLETSDEVLRGAIGFMDVEEGLSVHYSNAEDLHDLKIETECGPRLSASVFLEGQVDAFVGDFKIPMPSYDDDARHWSPIATVFSQNRIEKFVRHARKGVRLKKVTISISHDWLFAHLDRSDPRFHIFKEFAETHVSSLSWVPSTHAIGLAEQIIAAPNRSPFQHRLYIIARVYGLLDEAFQHFSECPVDPPVKAIDGQDRHKLLEIETFLDDQRGNCLTVEELARHIGMSQNSLQRLISRAYGLSASRFIRKFGLAKARTALERDGLTIAEAAHIAGYSSPANFSTAFKREFGLTPKQIV